MQRLLSGPEMEISLRDATEAAIICLFCFFQVLLFVPCWPGPPGPPGSTAPALRGSGLQRAKSGHLAGPDRCFAGHRWPGRCHPGRGTREERRGGTNGPQFREAWAFSQRSSWQTWGRARAALRRRVKRVACAGLCGPLASLSSGWFWPRGVVARRTRQRWHGWSWPRQPVPEFGGFVAALVRCSRVVAADPIELLIQIRELYWLSSGCGGSEMRC